MNSKVNIAFVAIILSLATSCSSSQKSHSVNKTVQERNRPNRRVPNLDSIFSMLDRNKDGKISKNEAQNARRGPLKTNFSAIDANNDGFVTKEEFKNNLPNKR